MAPVEGRNVRSMFLKSCLAVIFELKFQIVFQFGKVSGRAEERHQTAPGVYSPGLQCQGSFCVVVSSLLLLGNILQLL